MTSGTEDVHVSSDNDHLGLSYLHPEVLATESLIKILKERYIKRKKLEKMTRSELLELFYDYVMPMPQRIYGPGRRAQRLAQGRIKHETLKRKADDTDSWKLNKLCKSRTTVVDDTDISKDNNSSSKEASKRSYKLVNRGADVLNQEKNHVATELARPDHKTQKPGDDETVTKKPKRTPISWP